MSVLECIISEYDNMEQIIFDNGKYHSLSVIRDIDNIGAVFSRSRNMLGMMTMLPPLILQQLIWLQKAPN